jgi:ATP-dependent RNA helicase RhlE
MSFQSFPLDPRIFAGIEAAGYAEPTPIQHEAMPPLLERRDLIGVAQTGTGKTAAFVLPILQRLIDGPRGRLRALILAPTRELAEQIHQAIATLGRATGLRSAAVYGGVGWFPQEKALRTADIVVACPGRFLAHIEAHTAKLGMLEVVVLDEADRLFDMGFLPSIRRILRHLPAKRQTMLFSATMPDEVRRLAREALHDPTTVEVGAAAPIETVSHAFYPVIQGRKAALLSELLRRTEMKSAIVFTRTKHRAKALARELVEQGCRATSLQGNLSQNERRRALEGFRRGQFQVLVATDIVARGIDISNVSHVINFDAPDSADAYTHRIGRTGRATRTGEALTLVTGEDRDLMHALERVIGTPLEQRQLEGFDGGFSNREAFQRGPQRRGRGSSFGGRSRARKQWG